MKNKAWDVIIFDMDGVLVDSEPIHVKAEMLTCEHFNLDVPKHEWENFQGKTARDIADYILREYQKSGVVTSDEFIARKTNLYLELARTEIAPIAGSIEFVRESRIKFPEIALVTSSNMMIQRFIFQKYFADVRFDIIVTGDDIPAGKGKPHPLPYLTAIEKLSYPAEKCLVVEDSDNGVISAKAAGCSVIGITTSFSAEKLISVGADMVVDDYRQMNQLLFV